jgi:hypothetical protein
MRVVCECVRSLFLASPIQQADKKVRIVIYIMHIISTSGVKKYTPPRRYNSAVKSGTRMAARTERRAFYQNLRARFK